MGEFLSIMQWRYDGLRPIGSIHVVEYRLVPLVCSWILERWEMSGALRIHEGLLGTLGECVANWNLILNWSSTAIERILSWSLTPTDWIQEDLDLMSQLVGRLGSQEDLELMEKVVGKLGRFGKLGFLKELETMDLLARSSLDDKPERMECLLARSGVQEQPEAMEHVLARSSLDEPETMDYPLGRSSL